jgi:VanZ family protein
MTLPRRNPTRLPLIVAFGCVLVIVYASLQPFSGWLLSSEFSFSTYALPAKYVSWADVAFNVVAYLPLGFALYAITPPTWRSLHRFMLVIALAIALSFAVEMLQGLLPSRVASAYDTIANLVGALLGALIAMYILRMRTIVDALHSLRERWFVPGTAGDLQIILLVVWLLAHINPGIPLFGATFHPGMKEAFEPAVITVELAQTAAFVIGIGLFTDLTMRKRALGGIALVLVVALAVAMKTIAAHMFLTPIAWETWLRPGNALGIAAGAVALTILFWMPRRAKSIIAGIGLLSGVLMPVLLPDLLQQGPQLSQFAWSYGQLLNLNGLTRTVIVVWPLLATLVLLTRFGIESKPKHSDKAHRTA